MNLLDITFKDMIWVYLLLPLVGMLAYAFYLGYRKRQLSLSAFLNDNLKELFTQQVSGRLRTFKKALILISAAVLILAIARPQLGYFWEERAEETTDILFALDTSKSMLASDLKPNRLFRAKLAIEELVVNLEGVRIGLIPFAGDAFLWCPLTYDRQAFIDMLKGVDTSIIPTGGTDLLSAVEMAERAFSGDSTSSKIMILVTDGEDLSDQLEKKLPQIAARGWVIHSVGIGTEEGELIEITKADGSTTFVTDEDGNVVKTKLDVATLKSIAEQTGGSYQPLGLTGEGLQELFDQHIKIQLEKKEETRLRKIPIDRYQWFVAFALLILTIELLLKDRKRNLTRMGSAGTTASIITILFLFNPQPANASAEREAQRSFDEGDFTSAAALYQQALSDHPKKKQYSYNTGVSVLNNGDYESAKNAFDSALTGEDLGLQQQSYFNRGNTHYYLGRQVLDTNPQETIEYWENSIKDFENAISLDETDLEAENNRDEVKRLLERLKELLQQDDNQSDNDQDQQDDQDKGDNKEKQDNQDQGNDSGDQEQQEGSENQKNPKDNNSESEQEQKEKPAETEEEEKKSDKSEPSPSPQSKDGKGQKAPQPTPEEAEQKKEEALRLLDSLKNEDGDFKELFFKLQNPEAANKTGKDW